MVVAAIVVAAQEQSGYVRCRISKRNLKKENNGKLTGNGKRGGGLLYAAASWPEGAGIGSEAGGAGIGRGAGG